MAGGATQLVGQGGYVGRQSRSGVVDRCRAAFHGLGEGVLLTRRVAEGPGHVAHRRAGPVGDHVGHLGGVATSVTSVDVLDDLLPATAFNVDVNVGRSVPLRRHEPFEEQAQVDGVDVGDAQRVADRRVGRRSPPLAEDPRPAAEFDQVPYDQEVPTESQLADHGQLPVDLLPGPGDPFRLPGSVAVEGPGGGQTAQVGHFVEAVWAPEGREGGSDQLEVEGAAPAQFGGRLNHPGPPVEPAGLFDPGTQVGTGGRRQPTVQVVEGPAGPDRGHSGGQPPPGWPVVVDVVGGHRDDPGG